MHRQTALIADDEPLLRAQLRARLGELWPELEIGWEAANGLEVLAAFEGGARPGICFLDIQMPGLSGMEAARRIQASVRPPPRFVFITAFDNFAVEAFERAAVDYVLKPICPERLMATVQRLLDDAERPPEQNVTALLARLAEVWKDARPAYLQWIRASVGNTVRMIPVADVHYFKSDDKYTSVVTAEGEVLIRKSIKELAGELDPTRFWQIHRATIVNAAAISGVVRGVKDSADVRMKNRSETLTVSRAYLHRFKQM